jgi:hypothetical protein
MGARLKADLLIRRFVLVPLRTRFARFYRDMPFAVRIPASTSNLGPGFDCFGLALKLYLTVHATAVPDSSEPCRVTTPARKKTKHYHATPST